MKKRTICELCKINCILKVIKNNEEIKVSGNYCEKGIDFGIEKIESKKAGLSTVVRLKGAKEHILPVKTRGAVEKNLFIEISKALSRVYVGTPVKIGDIICKNILNTGIDVIAAKNVLE